MGTKINSSSRNVVKEEVLKYQQIINTVPDTILSMSDEMGTLDPNICSTSS